MPERTCTCTTLRRVVAAGAAALLVAAPAAAVGQEAPPADGTPVSVTITAPSSVKHTGLKKGFPVKVTCSTGCSARVSLSGKIGIIEEKTIRVAAGSPGSARLRATSSQARELAKGSKLNVVVIATGADGGRGNATKTVTVR